MCKYKFIPNEINNVGSNPDSNQSRIIVFYCYLVFFFFSIVRNFPNHSSRRKIKKQKKRKKSKPLRFVFPFSLSLAPRMAEEMQEQATETVKKETPDESLDIESQVKEAMLSRVSHFKKQAE